MDTCKTEDTSDKTVSFSFKHSSLLSSLTINHCSLSMEELELLLSRTPALVHLKLVSRERTFDSMFDGYNWEQFIRAKLHRLNKFEFFFSYIDKTDDDITNVDSLVDSFRTPFWLYDKRWFITCDYVFESQAFNLYTPSISIAGFENSIRCEISAVDGMYSFAGLPVNKRKYFNEDEVSVTIILIS
jgi:hypothetical protein